MRGVNPTRRQKLIIAAFRLDPSTWLVCQDTSDYMLIKHRHTDRLMCLPKELIKNDYGNG